MKRILFLSFLLCTIAASAQTVEWFTMPGGDENNNGQGIGYTATSDFDGNIYFSGYKQNPYDYNDTYGDIYFSKYSSSGEMLFSKTFTGKVASYNIVADSEGSIIIALSFIEEMIIGETTVTDITESPVWVIAKLDSEGTLSWYEVLSIDEGPGGTFVNDFRGLAVDAEDNVYAAYDNYMNSHIVKYSPDGEVLMDIAQQNVNRVTSVAVDSDGNIYGAGACAGPNAVYAEVAAPTDLTYNTYIVKYSSLGEFQWVKYIDDITCPEPHVVAKSPNEVYMSSFLFTDTAFDAIDIEGPVQAFDDFFIVKLDENGDYQWVREVPGAGAGVQGSRNFLSLDIDGNVYFAGQTGGTVNWGPGITTTVEGFSNRDAFIIKYNPEGQVVMAKSWGSESYEYIDGITINDEGEIFAVGLLGGTGDFGGFTYEGEAWEYKPFLAKISEPTAGIGNLLSKSVTLYPNPATDVFMLQGVDKPVSGAIFNSLGQQVLEFNTDGILPVNVSVLPTGTYFIKTDGFTITKLMKK